MVFARSLALLMETLNKATPHYIRCIKPNEHKLADSFNARLCCKQLRCSGVYEAVTIRRSAFPFRLAFRRFA